MKGLSQVHLYNVVFESGLPSEKKKKANILTLKSKLAASDGNEDGGRGMSLSRFFFLSPYFNYILNSLKRKAGVG